MFTSLFHASFSILAPTEALIPSVGAPTYSSAMSRYARPSTVLRPQSKSHSAQSVPITKKYLFAKEHTLQNIHKPVAIFDVATGAWLTESLTHIGVLCNIVCLLLLCFYVKRIKFPLFPYLNSGPHDEKLITKTLTNCSAYFVVVVVVVWGGGWSVSEPLATWWGVGERRILRRNFCSRRHARDIALTSIMASHPHVRPPRDLVTTPSATIHQFLMAPCPVNLNIDCLKKGETSASFFSRKRWGQRGNMHSTTLQ
jgi:hypothetical protein